MVGRTLRAEGLRVERGGAPVLHDVTLTVEPGRPLALLGASGSGKTTLLLTLAGLITPSAGRVFLGDLALSGASTAALERLRRSTVALLSQQLELLPLLTVERNTALSPLIAGLPAAVALSRARSELDALDMGAVLHRRAEALSRGQRQRVALARALAHPGSVLLLDEPSTALDAALRQRLIERLSAAAAAGQTILLATHDPELAAWAAESRAIVGGRLEAP